MSCHWDNKIKTRTTVKQFLKKTPPKDKFMPTYCKKKKKKKKNGGMRQNRVQLLWSVTKHTNQDTAWV